MSRSRASAVALSCCLLIALAALAAEVPTLTGRVVDTAQILSVPARSRIEAALAAHEQKTTNQVVLLTVPGIEPEVIEEYAQRVFESWKLGIKGKDNGVLVLVVPQERKLRIHTGYGVEGVLPDVIASRIIRDVIAPRFQAKDYDAGLEQGITTILVRLEGSASPIVDPPKPGFLKRFDRAATNAIYYTVWSLMLLILGYFTFRKATSPGGWLAYVIFAPLWWILPATLIGPAHAWLPAVVFLAGYPIAKLTLRRTQWYHRINARR